MPRLDESLISDLLSSKLSKSEFIKISPRKEDDEKFSPQQNLWRGVILQAIVDASNNSTKLEMRKIKAKAIAWLHSDNDDVKYVCEMAGFELCYIKKCVKKILSQTPQEKKLNIIKKKIAKLRKEKSNRGRKPKTPIKESLFSGNFIFSDRNIS
ncbi:MAG: hypothetical protein SFT90_02355 [Rickettsiales bacterium]|nr:hypothetical protein [Rickettsiales bacterium]